MGDHFIPGKPNNTCGTAHRTHSPLQHAALHPPDAHVVRQVGLDHAGKVRHRRVRPLPAFGQRVGLVKAVAAAVPSEVRAGGLDEDLPGPAALAEGRPLGGEDDLLAVVRRLARLRLDGAGPRAGAQVWAPAALHQARPPLRAEGV